MQHFLAGFFSALPLLVFALGVRYVKDAFRAGIRPESSFTE